MAPSTTPSPPDLSGPLPDPIRDEIEGLLLDTIATWRAMLEHGTLEDRIAVMKAVPQMKGLLGEKSEQTTTVQSKALDYLARIADHLRDITGSPRDDITADDLDDEGW